MENILSMTEVIPYFSDNAQLPNYNKIVKVNDNHDDGNDDVDDGVARPLFSFIFGWKKFSHKKRAVWLRETTEMMMLMLLLLLLLFLLPLVLVLGCKLL